VSRPHSRPWSVPLIAALALALGACAAGELPEASGENPGSADRGEQPDGESGGVDGGPGDSDEGDGPPDPDEADPGDDGEGGDDGEDGEDGEDGASIVCPLCDDAFTLCFSTATTTQDSLACEWQWVRCALPRCDLGDATQCFIALDTCFRICETLSECVACSLAGQECY
jgi:hypothetical protein